MWSCRVQVIWALQKRYGSCKPGWAPMDASALEAVFRCADVLWARCSGCEKYCVYNGASEKCIRIVKSSRACSGGGRYEGMSSLGGCQCGEPRPKTALCCRSCRLAEQPEVRLCALAHQRPRHYLKLPYFLLFSGKCQ